MSEPNKRKIFNDPVYGFIEIPYQLAFEVIEHPYFQRLRRIKQLGLTEYVYPGALHTRFHHALGAMHLMGQAIEVLRNKGQDISEAEAIGATIAILLHDIGHGPYSHTLEHIIVDLHHETLTSMFLAALNEEFEGKLTTAIAIFEDKYPKPFLHQLISGQLDMDRMDYLSRDSYFTGVTEGAISYHRLIKMLDVVNGELVVEEKGLYSVENFLIARRLMYWQVYLHKTVVCAEQMLILIFKRIKHLKEKGIEVELPDNIAFFLYNNDRKCDYEKNPKLYLDTFAKLDDSDVIFMIKNFANNAKIDKTLSYLSEKLLNRRLFKIILQSKDFSKEEYNSILSDFLDNTKYADIDPNFLIIKGKESNNTYSKKSNEINILKKNKQVVPLSTISEDGISSKLVTKYLICYPK